MAGVECAHRCAGCESTTALGLDALATAIQALTAALQPPAVAPPRGGGLWRVATHDAGQPWLLVVAGSPVLAIALCNDRLGLGTVDAEDLQRVNLREPRILPAHWTEEPE